MTNKRKIKQAKRKIKQAKRKLATKSEFYKEANKLYENPYTDKADEIKYLECNMNNISDYTILDLKDYTAFYLDDFAPDDDPLFKYLNLIPNSEKWLNWKAEDITDEQIIEIKNIAQEQCLDTFLNGYDELSEGGFLALYQKCKI